MQQKGNSLRAFPLEKFLILGNRTGRGNGSAHRRLPSVLVKSMYRAKKQSFTRFIAALRKADRMQMPEHRSTVKCHSWAWHTEAACKERPKWETNRRLQLLPVHETREQHRIIAKSELAPYQHHPLNASSRAGG